MLKHLFAGFLVLALLGSARADVVSRDGKLKAVPNGNTITIVDVASGKEILKLAGHTGGVTALAFSPDGKLLISGGLDKAVMAWDVPTGKLLWQQTADGAVKDLDIAAGTVTVSTAGGKVVVDLATGKRVR
jgi:WD40 repeat protein